jgi:hypothetical protein
MKYVSLALLLFPFAAAAQFPVPLTPDWLKQTPSAAEVLNSTHVTLMENNFRIVQTNVIGKSRGFKLLGLITIKPASHTRAMSQLYGKAQVEPGRPQALANVVRESGSTFLILFSLPKVTIRADLIEFTELPENAGTNEPAVVRVRGQQRER